MSIQKQLKSPETKPLKTKELPNVARVVLTAQREALFDPQQGVWFHPGKPTEALATPLVVGWLLDGGLKSEAA